MTHLVGHAFKSKSPPKMYLDVTMMAFQSWSPFSRVWLFKYQKTDEPDSECVAGVRRPLAAVGTRCV